MRLACLASVRRAVPALTDQLSPAARVPLLKGRSVLVLGDVMLDEYIYGSADRISPEAPVPVVRLERRVYSGGGAANTASNVASLGGTPYLVGVAGIDSQSQQLRQALA